jgi:hypothetical protein
MLYDTTELQRTGAVDLISSCPFVDSYSILVHPWFLHGQIRILASHLSWHVIIMASLLLHTTCNSSLWCLKVDPARVSRSPLLANKNGRFPGQHPSTMTPAHCSVDYGAAIALFVPRQTLWLLNKVQGPDSVPRPVTWPRSGLCPLIWLVALLQCAGLPPVAPIFVGPLMEKKTRPSSVSYRQRAREKCMAIFSVPPAALPSRRQLLCAALASYVTGKVIRSS